MEREYIAFISYRHKPLDIKIAKQLHRLIERYRIPHDLRKDHSNRLGYVFRDQDELPLSSDLSADLKSALDRSSFLIVICTPDTPKSPWVRQEIEYFLKNHDRKYVLAVLADGTPEESFPEQITHIYEEDGITLNRIVEPLAANVVSHMQFKRHFLVKTEFLRLVAAMLNCPYDTLKQRAKRQRQQQISVASLAVAVTAIGFAATVIMKNNEIRAKSEEIQAQNIEIQAKNAEIQKKNDEIQFQLEQAQRNESYALSLVSEQLLGEGDRDGAVENALNALPSASQERPVVAEAELALCNALYAYQDVDIRVDCRIEQETNIKSMLFSEDGSYVLTMDDYGVLRCYNGNNAKLLWEREGLSPDGSLALIEAEQAVCYTYYNGLYIETLLLSLQEGAVLSELSIDKGIGAGRSYVSEDGETAAYLVGDINDRLMFDCQICFYRIPTMELISESPVLGRSISIISMKEEGNYCFSPDGKRYALDLMDSQDGKTLHTIYVLDVATGNTLYSVTYEEQLKQFNMEMIFLPEGDLMVFCHEEQYRLSYLGIHAQYAQYLERFSGDTGELVYSREFSEEDPSSSMVTLLLDEEKIWYVGNKDIISFELESGDLCDHTVLSVDCKACYWLDEEHNEYVMISEDGRVGARRAYDNSDAADIAFDIGFKFSQAYGNGSGMDYICAIPEEQKNHAVIYRYRGDEQKKELQVLSTLVNTNTLTRTGELHFFPSGDRAMIIDRELDSKLDGSLFITYALVVYDMEPMEEMDRISSKVSLVFKGFSRDEKKLIFSDCVYDLETGTFLDLPKPFENSGVDLAYFEMPYEQQAGMPTVLAAFQDCAHGEAGELYWCEDGGEFMQSPCPYEGEVSKVRISEKKRVYYVDRVVTGESGLIAVALDGLYSLAPKGYAVYSTREDSWAYIENSCQESGYPVFCVGHANPWVAFGDYDGVLRIADGNTGEILKNFPLGMTTDGVKEMQFLLNDTLLLIRHTDFLRILNTEDGTVKASLRLNGFSDSSDLFVRIDEERNSLYIGEHSGKMEGACIDLSTGKIRALIPGLVCYAPDTRQVIKRNATNNNYVSYPAYTVQELVEKGEKLLGQ